MVDLVPILPEFGLTGVILPGARYWNIVSFKDEVIVAPVESIMLTGKPEGLAKDEILCHWELQPLRLELLLM